jgi:hypothetical protein
MNKALKINVETKTIEVVMLPKHFESISKAIGNGCEYFCCPITFSNDDCIYADDESLLRIDNIKGGFVMEGWRSPIVGNAIVLGTDAEGDSVDAKSDVDELLSQIVFIDETMAKDYAKETMSKPPTIIFS